MSMKEDYEIILASTEIRAHQEGESIGEQKGRDAEKREIAKALKSMGVPVEKIAAASGLSQTEIETL